jgi:uroporphyrinogen-III synthase
VADHSPSPLAGKRVIITRAESQSATLGEALRAKGAEIVSFPLIRIDPPDDLAPLDAVLRNLSTFDWLIFTSQNAVAAVTDRLATPTAAVIPSGARNLSSMSVIPPASVHVAAVGKSTAEAAEAAGFVVAHTGKGTAAVLVHELADKLRGKRVFLPRSDRAAAALVAQLRDLGANITEVVAYRTVALDSVDKTQRESVSEADAIVFFSPSAVNAFLALAKSGVLSSLRTDAAVGAIGPVTCVALREAGLRCDFLAQEPSVDEIVVALTTHFEKAKVSSVSGANSR